MSALLVIKQIDKVKDYRLGMINLTPEILEYITPRRFLRQMANIYMDQKASPSVSKMRTTLRSPKRKGVLQPGNQVTEKISHNVLPYALKVIFFLQMAYLLSCCARLLCHQRPRRI